MDPATKDIDTENLRLQEDEIQALTAIFGDEWTTEGENMFSIRIRNRQNQEVYFQVTLPGSYPLHSPPVYQISAPWMNRDAKSQLQKEIENIYCQNMGESIIYTWIDAIQNFIEKRFCNQSKAEEYEEVALICTKQEIQTEDNNFEIPVIEHGEPIIDRKSVFQAHLAKVLHVNQVSQVLTKLKESRKIATATHNIYAYRIAGANKNSFIQGCEDDGETRAGSGLLHLLQVLDVSDVLIIVSRWYGGVHLGPDRFKHINNAARSLLNQLGYIKNEKTKTPIKSTKK